MLTTDCFNSISMFSVAWTPFELFMGLHLRTKIEIEQMYSSVKFMHMQSFHLFTSIMY